MKSPFPGMDPYMEQRWGDLHTRLATDACDQIQEQLPSDLLAVLEEHIAVQSSDPDEDLDPHGYYPDIRVEEMLESSTTFAQSESEVAIADCIQLPRILEPLTQRSIRIVEPDSGNRIISAIEFLSPSNKVGAEGRKDYQRKRTELFDAGVSLVEIDLIRRGRPNLAIAMSAIPPKYRTTYRVCVVRGWQLSRAFVYRISLQQRLPVVAIPLRQNDKEVSLNLQTSVELAYRKGRYARIDYSKDPVPPLTGDDAVWADTLLREKGLRH